MRTHRIDQNRSVYRQIPDESPYQSMAASAGSLLYRFYDSAGQLLYIGITSRPRERWTAHSRTAQWWTSVGEVRITGERMKESAARRAETYAIHDEAPLHNIAKVRESSRPAHGVLTESSLITPIGKGREGKGIGGEGESTSKPIPIRLVSDGPSPERWGWGC